MDQPPASPIAVGKTCPFCQSPIKPGVSVHVCPACGIPHHTECWQSNGGCTTFGCTNHTHATPHRAVPMHLPPAPRALAPLAPNTVLGILDRWSNGLAGRFQIGAFGRRIAVVRQEDAVCYILRMTTLTREQLLEAHEAPDGAGAAPLTLSECPWSGPSVPFGEGPRVYMVEGSQRTAPCSFCAGAAGGCARCDHTGRIRHWQTLTVTDRTSETEEIINPTNLPEAVLRQSEGETVDSGSADGRLPDGLFAMAGVSAHQHVVQRTGTRDVPALRESLRAMRDRQPGETDGHSVVRQEYEITGIPVTSIDYRMIDLRAAVAPYMVRPAAGRQRVLYLCGIHHRIWPERPPRGALFYGPAVEGAVLASLALVWGVLALITQHPAWAVVTLAALLNTAVVRWRATRVRRVLSGPPAVLRSRWQRWWDGRAHPALTRVAWAAHMGLAGYAAGAVSTPGDAAPPALLAALGAIGGLVAPSLVVHKSICRTEA